MEVVLQNQMHRFICMKTFKVLSSFDDWCRDKELIPGEIEAGAVPDGICLLHGVQSQCAYMFIAQCAYVYSNLHVNR